MSDDVDLLTRIYELFNRRDIERVLAAHSGTPQESCTRLVERNVFAHESKHAEDFLHSVERLLRKPKNCRDSA